jgi:flagellar biosynthesis GTPase FlhF
MDTLAVFISSHIGEFLAERKSLKAALERWPFVRAWAFEAETAYAEPRDAGYLRRAAEADIFVLLLGDQPSDAVENEFATALNAKRPILAFAKRSAQDREAKVIEAVGDEILYRFRLTHDQTRQIVQVLPRLSEPERDELDRAYLAEVAQKYEFWRTRYTPLAAIARLRPESAPIPAATPAEFLPRGFDVLLREKFPRERERREMDERRETREKTEHYDDLRDAVEKHGDLILLGDPGAGKTTTLWWLMYDYAQRAQQPNHQTTQPPNHPTTKTTDFDFPRSL